MLSLIVTHRSAIRRSVQVFASYLANAGILIACIFILGKHVAPETLKSFLVYFLVASTAAGLDPGTSKASLTSANAGAPFEGGAPLLLASSVKALLISPALLLIWAVSSGETVALSELVWAPIITILGFAATDMRVAFDAQGRYALAIWGKQGSLALAALVPSIALVLDQDLAIGIAAACLARTIWIAAFWFVAMDDGAASVSAFQHLFRRPWKHLMATSCLGALSASIDRIAAFRFLDPISANTYVLAYEILTKFWLLNYLFAPIVFVQTAKFGKANTISRYAYQTIAFAAIPFLALAMLFPFAPLPNFMGLSLESIPLLLFGAAIVLTAFSGILLMEAQALKSAKMATVSAAIGLIVAAVAFPTFLSLWGINGLFAAWLAKSSAEFLVLLGVRVRAQDI